MRKTILSGRFPKKGESKLTMVNSDYYRGLVRAIQVMDLFDRVSLAVLLHSYPSPKGKMFDAVVVKLVELFDNGFIEPATVDTSGGVMSTEYEYIIGDIEQNPELVGDIDFSQGKRNVVVYRKSAAWTDFMGLWAAFIG